MIVSLDLWGLVLWGTIYRKLRSIETAIREEKWEEGYHFYSDEDYEDSLIPQETLDPSKNTTQGNIIHLEQRLFSKKKDPH